MFTMRVLTILLAVLLAVLLTIDFIFTCASSLTQSIALAFTRVSTYRVCIAARDWYCSPFKEIYSA